MTIQKNVKRVMLEAVTHQDQATGQNEWPILAIEQVADVNPRIDKSAIPDDLPVSFVPMPAVGAGDGSIHVEETRPAGEVKKGFTAFLEGDLLFAKITPCMENGKMAVVPKLVNGYGFGSTEFHVLRLKPGMDVKYLYYYVSSKLFRGEAERYMTGAVGQKRVSTDYLKRSKIPVAPLDQQKHIVAEIEKQFSRLDEAVANLKRVKANLKRYKASVLKAAVEGRLVETEAELARKKLPLPPGEGGGEGASYETGAQLLQRILETRRSQWKGKDKYKEPAAPDINNLPELPEGWVWGSVEQMAEVGTGATPLRSKRAYYDDGKVPWVTSGALNEEFVSAADEYITKLAVKETNAKLFPAHTLLVAMYGEGKTRGKVSELLIDAATNQACAAIVMEGLSANVREYAKLFLLKNYDDIRRLSSGGVQPNLNLGHIKATAIPLPPLAEQHRIVAEIDRRLSLIREVETQVDTNLKRAERLRQSILSKVFSGKFILNHMDTPAKKIKVA